MARTVGLASLSRVRPTLGEKRILTNDQKYALLLLRFGVVNRGNRWIWIPKIQAPLVVLKSCPTSPSEWKLFWKP